MCFNAGSYLYLSTCINVHVSRHTIYVCEHAHRQKFLFLILQELHLSLFNTRDCTVIKPFFFLKKNKSRLELGHCFLCKYLLSETVKITNIWCLYLSSFEQVGITLFSLKAGWVFCSSWVIP